MITDHYILKVPESNVITYIFRFTPISTSIAFISNSLLNHYLLCILPFIYIFPSLLSILYIAVLLQYFSIHILISPYGFYYLYMTPSASLFLAFSFLVSLFLTFSLFLSLIQILTSSLPQFPLPSLFLSISQFLSFIKKGDGGEEMDERHYNIPHLCFTPSISFPVLLFRLSLSRLFIIIPHLCMSVSLLSHALSHLRVLSQSLDIQTFPI